MTPPVANPEDVLRGLMNTKDKRVQLRAAVAYIRLLATKKTACQACADLADHRKDQDDLYKRYTKAQREELYALCARMREIQAQARTQGLNEENQ